MEYLAQEFENTADGLKRKEAFTQQVSASGYRILKEEVKHSERQQKKGCGALIFLPLLSRSATTATKTVVTYGRESVFCGACGSAVSPADRVCPACDAEVSEATTIADRTSAQRIEEGRQEAARRTAEINQRIDELSRILTDTLTQDHHFDWNLLRQKFTVAEPERPAVKEMPPKSAILHLPALFPLLAKLMPSLHEKHIAWQRASEENQEHNRTVVAQYEGELEHWRKRRDVFDGRQTALVETNTRLCLAKDEKTLLLYWDMVLERSQYPDHFPRSHTLDYAPGEQRLTVDFTLPPISVLPHTGEVKYDPFRKVLEDIRVSGVWLFETYNDLIVQVALRTIFELFESDVADALSSVAFRGHLRPESKDTDEAVASTLLSIEVGKGEFMQINLGKADPMKCFKRLGGVLSHTAANTLVTPIQPEE